MGMDILCIRRKVFFVVNVDSKVVNRSIAAVDTVHCQRLPSVHLVVAVACGKIPVVCCSSGCSRGPGNTARIEAARVDVGHGSAAVDDI